jgi:hypothetical protein
MRNNVLRPRTWIVAFLLGLLLWGSGQAFAGYDARGSELKQTLAKDALTSQQERDVLQHALDSYLGAREKCLDELVGIVAETSTGKTRQESAWETRIDDCEVDASKLAGAIESISGTPSPAARTFADEAAVQEQRFFETLKATKVAERRDHLIENQKNVVALRDQLREEWEALKSQDDEIDAQEKEVADQIEEALQHGAEEAARQHRTIKERVAANLGTISRFTRTWGKGIVALLGLLTGADLQTLKDAIAGISGSAPQIEATTQNYVEANLAYVNRVAEYKALVQSERGGVFVLFKEFRDSTQRFVDNHGFDKAQEEYQQASDAMSEWASLAESPGARSDAEAFGKDVMEKLTGHLEKTKTEFNTFVSQNKDRFFGPISPDITKALTEPRVWQDWQQSIQGLDLAAKLSQWRDQADTFFGISNSSLSSEDQKYLEELIQARINELLKAIDEDKKIPAQLQLDFDRSGLDGDLE